MWSPLSLYALTLAIAFGIGVEFFNQLAAFPKGPVALSLEKQVPIIPGAFLKINNKYKDFLSEGIH